MPTQLWHSTRVDPQEETMRDEVYPAATSMVAREPGWLTPSIQKSHERSETFGLSTS
jgi:hypothetical protein